MRSLVLLVAACSGASKGPIDPMATSNAVKLEWRAQAHDADVDVTLLVAGQEQALGSLSAGSDATCTMRKAEATVSEFACSTSAAYSYFVAELKEGQVIVSLVTGMTGDPNSEERKVVKRVDVQGTSFYVVPYQAS